MTEALEALIERGELSVHYLTFPFQAPSIEETQAAAKVIEDMIAMLRTLAK